MWRLDPNSLLIGLVLGAGLAGLAIWAWPHVQRLRHQSLNRMRETSLWVRAGVESRFQAETADYVERYHLGGQWARLPDIFVEPRLLADPYQAEGSYERFMPAQDLIYLWPELAGRVVIPPVPTMTIRQLLLRGRRVLLTSPAGTGKTTLLAYCAHICAHAGDTGPYTFLLPVMPVFVHLAELDLNRPVLPAGEIDYDPVLPLAVALQRRSGPLTAPGVGGLLREKLATGQVLLLMDGGDEGLMDHFPVQWLADLLATFPDLQVIAAAPPAGYGPLLDLDFTVSGCLPWRLAEAVAFGRAWSNTMKSSPALELDRYWTPGRNALETTLCLWQHLGILSADNPANGPIPVAQPACYETALAGWLAKLNGDSAEIRLFWSALAFELLSVNRHYLLKAEVVTLIENLFAPRPEAEQPAGIPSRLSNTLWKSIQQCGLFIIWEGERVALRSPAWRDYLAADYLATRCDHETVLAQIHNPQWVAVLRFYTGRCGEQNLSTTLLDSHSGDLLRDGLFQVADWLPNAEPAGEWRRQALIQLGQIVVQGGVPQALRQRAVAAISLSGDKGVTTLLRQLMQRTETELRQAVALAMTNQEEMVALSVLENMFHDGVSSVREMVVYCLGWLPQKAAERLLVLALIDRDPAVSRAAAVSLAGRGAEGWQILREAAEDEAVHVRRAAVFGLAEWGTFEAVEWLEKMALEDKEFMVKSAATLILDDLAALNRPEPWRPQPAGELLWLVDWARRRNQSIPEGSGAVTLLCELVNSDEQPAIRALAARSLGQVQLAAGQVGEAQKTLRTAWGEPHQLVRDAAFYSWVRLVRAYGIIQLNGRPFQ